MAEVDPVRNRVFNFWKTESLSEKKREEEHRADAGEQQRTRGAHNANSLRLGSYGFLRDAVI